MLACTLPDDEADSLQMLHGGKYSFTGEKVLGPVKGDISCLYGTVYYHSRVK